MEPDFSAEEWAKLTKIERIAKCERYAMDAEENGQEAVAKQWRKLAAEIETAPIPKG